MRRTLRDTLRFRNRLGLPYRALAVIGTALTCIAGAAHGAAPLRGVRPESASFALVVQAGEPLVVIRNVLAEGVRSGAPVGLPGSEKSVLRGVRLNRLSLGARAWLGRSVRLYDDRGVVCEARIRELGVWTRRDDAIRNVDANGEPEAALEQDALVARLGTLSGDCGKARWARDASLRPPAVFPRAAQVPGKLLRDAETELRALPLYRRIQNRYLTEATAPRAKTWDSSDGATSQTTLFVDSAGQPAFISIARNAGAGCGEFGATLWATWQIKKDGTLALVSPDTESFAYPHEPAAMLRLGRTRALHTLTDGTLFRLGKQEITDEKNLSVQFYSGCGC